MHRLFVLASSLAVLLAAGEALGAPGDPVPSLDLRGYRPSTDPRGGLFLEPASSPDHGEWNVGAYLSYVNRPVVLREPGTGTLAFQVLAHQLTGDVVAGIGAFGRLFFGADLPFALYQTGDKPTAASTNMLGPTNIPAQALGDLALTGKWTMVAPTGGDLGGFGLALHERFTVPTGDQASFLGEGAVTSTTRIFAEYRLIAVGVRASAGVLLRAEPERFACGPLPSSPRDTCRTRMGHELPFGLGLTLRPQALGIDEAGRWTLFLEGQGHLPLYPVVPLRSRHVAALEVGLGARVALGDFSLLGGLSTGFFGGIGTGPVRAMLSFGWAPRDHDADKDGVPDDKDQCRELPEDKDGFEDSDGCPDGDNDDDGIPDNEDKCPNKAEDEDGVQDEDGCPE
jgi:hypothetical protein